MCDQQRVRPACAYAQSDQSLCKSLEYSMNVQLLAEQHFEFLSLKEGCTEWSESTLVKLPYCWKSHVTAHFTFQNDTIEDATSYRYLGLYFSASGLFSYAELELFKKKLKGYWKLCKKHFEITSIY